ncbi:MAG: hypothetical protein WBA66_02855 [Xanthobacteraceae bacterium]
MNRTSREIGVDAILNDCMAGTIPVNTDVEVAIEAHQVAIERWRKNRDDSDQSLAWLTLRAITLASTPTMESVRRQIDYLTALPMDAWECTHVERECSAADYREQMLDCIARDLATMFD